MSEFKSVKVVSVEVKTGGGVDGKKEWTKFMLVDGNDGRASTFDKKIGQFLQEHIGKQVDITVEQDGKFTNLLSAVEHIEAPKANGNGNGSGYTRDPDTEMRIAREACLKVAAQIAPVTGTIGARPSVKDVIRISNVLVRWVYTGESPALAAAIAADPTLGVPTFDPDEIPF